MQNFSIAVAGKGGSGKTTFVSLLSRALARNKKGPVLAVDADPNANLNLLLGMEYDETLSDLREDTVKGKLPSGATRTDFVNMGIHQTLVEGKDIDLLVMGRPEGRGCYCAVNHLLREFLDRLSKNYPYMLIDNEAGMEHLSRRTTNDVDVLFLISDASLVSLRSAIKAYETAQRIELNIKKTYLVLNRIKQMTGEINERIKQSKLELIGILPYDEELNRTVEQGKSILGGNVEFEVLKATEEILQKVKIL